MEFGKIPLNQSNSSLKWQTLELEQRQNKRDSIQSKIIPILKLARFFPHHVGGEKARQIQSWNYFLTDWSHSYIVLALAPVRS